MSPLKYQSKSGPTSSFSSAMKPSTDTTACIITVATPGQTYRDPQTHRSGASLTAAWCQLPRRQTLGTFAPSRELSRTACSRKASSGPDREMSGRLPALEVTRSGPTMVAMTASWSRTWEACQPVLARSSASRPAAARGRGDAGDRPPGAAAPHAPGEPSPMDGWRFQAFASDTATGRLAQLEARQGAHPEVEDRIPCGKNTDYGRSPSRTFPINAAWLERALAGCRKPPGAIRRGAPVRDVRGRAVIDTTAQLAWVMCRRPCVGGDDVVGVAVEVLADAVVAHRRSWVGVPGGDLDIAQVHAGVQHRGHVGVAKHVWM